MNEMNVVYRALKIAREEGTIPWDWIVDEARELELISTWKTRRGAPTVSSIDATCGRRSQRP